MTIEDNDLCICGHTAKRHILYMPFVTGCLNQECLCREFRPVPVIEETSSWVCPQCGSIEWVGARCSWCETRRPKKKAVEE